MSFSVQRIYTQNAGMRCLTKPKIHVRKGAQMNEKSLTSHCGPKPEPEPEPKLKPEPTSKPKPLLRSNIGLGLDLDLDIGLGLRLGLGRELGLSLGLKYHSEGKGWLLLYLGERLGFSFIWVHKGVIFFAFINDSNGPYRNHCEIALALIRFVVKKWSMANIVLTLKVN